MSDVQVQIQHAVLTRVSELSDEIEFDNLEMMAGLIGSAAVVVAGLAEEHGSAFDQDMQARPDAAPQAQAFYDCVEALRRLAAVVGLEPAT